MNKPRILILENSVVMTGAMRAIITSSLSLQDSFEFQFIVPTDSFARLWLKKAGFTNVLEWKITEISKRLSALVFYLPRLIINGLRLKKHVRQHRIDIIHVNDLYNLIPAVAAFLGCRAPYICHVRFMPGAFPGRLFRFWLRIHLKYARKIIVVSEALKQSIPSHEKIEVVYDGMFFDEINNPQRISTGKSLTFLYLANMIPGKGQDIALDTFLTVHQQLPAWKLRFVGGDNGIKKNAEYIDSLKRKAGKNGIADKLEWQGFVEDVATEYRSADIVLNFSESESFSMSSLEALSFGRPLIVSNCGGPAELVDDHVTGILIPNRDVASMAAAMIELAGSGSLREELGRNAAKQMKLRFDARVTSQKLAAAYRNSLNSI